MQVTGRGSGEKRVLESVVAEHHDWIESEYGQMNGRTTVHGRTARGDGLEYDAHGNL